MRRQVHPLRSILSTHKKEALKMSPAIFRIIRVPQGHEISIIFDYEIALIMKKIRLNFENTKNKKIDKFDLIILSVISLNIVQKANIFRRQFLIGMIAKKVPITVLSPIITTTFLLTALMY